MLNLPFLKPSPESLVRQLRDLPPAPKVLQRLQAALAKPDIALPDLAELVAIEPGLSGRVVRVANSAQFGRGARIDTIVDAIQRVGLVGVEELVTYAVASQLVGRPLQAYGLDAQTIWSRAIACAIAASSLAERSEVDRTDAYTAGLMHGVGLVVIDNYALKQRTSKVLHSEGYPQDYAPAERAWLDFSHAEAGAALLEFWGFSESVVTAVRSQLAPMEVTGPYRQLAMILAIARWARSLFCVPEENIPELPSNLWLSEAGVHIGDFGDWLSQVQRRFTLARDELRLG